MQFTVKTNELKALLICAAKKDIRTYLNGIHFESTTSGLVAVSTDGHRLLAVNFDTSTDWQAFGVNIPREAIEKAVKTKAVSLIVTLDGDKFTLDDGSQAITGLICEGVFPDWRRVIPNDTSDTTASFNNEYLHDFDKVARLLCGGNAYIAQNGEQCALVRFASDKAIGAVMPLRKQDFDASVPAFVQAGKIEDLKAA